MAILDTITTITTQWVFDGEVKCLGGKINNSTQSWSITDIMLIDYFDLSFAKNMYVLKNSDLLVFLVILNSEKQLDLTT